MHTTISPLPQSQTSSSLDKTENQFLIAKKKLENFLTVNVISSINDFMEIKDDWKALTNKSIKLQPFMLWEWQMTWWETFANKNDELCIICVYKNGTPIAIAPFYFKKQSIGKSLRLIGEGEPYKEEVVTHYPDILLARPEYESLVLEYIANELKQSNHKWDFASFSFVLEDSLLLKLQKRLLDINSFCSSLGHRYRIKLPKSYDQFLAKLGKSTRKNIRSKRNRMSNVGPLAIKTSSNAIEKLKYYEKLANFHRKQQIKQGKTSIFDEPRFNEFHHKFIEKLGDNKSLEFKALTHNNDTVAITYNLVIKDEVFSYINGYYSSDDKRYSPMLVFDSMEMELLIAEGFQYYDFLSADSADTYKKHYRCEEDPVSRINWYRPTIIGYLYQYKTTLRRLASLAKRNILALI